MKLSKTQINISKTISYALRHKPEEFGLTLDNEGWVDIDVFIEAFAKYRQPIHISENDIKAIIDSSEKKRFEISNGKIRATYGHSTKSRIEFSETVPPNILYHGTSHKAIDNIKHEGLKPMNRQYVHLSSDFKTARIVGSRHDKNPIILTVDSKKMYLDGFKFFHSAHDGTWMCEKVTPDYIISATKDD